MSTGLTYVTIFDVTNASPDLSSGAFIFSDYDEALAWSLWYADYARTTSGYTSDQLRLTIWTSGPNPNGQAYWASGAASFAPYL